MAGPGAGVRHSDLMDNVPMGRASQTITAIENRYLEEVVAEVCERKQKGNDFVYQLKSNAIADVNLLYYSFNPGATTK